MVGRGRSGWRGARLAELAAELAERVEVVKVMGAVAISECRVWAVVEPGINRRFALFELERMGLGVDGFQRARPPAR